MKRTTVTLSQELAVAVEREARRLDVSVSEVVRRAVAEHLGFASPGRGRRRLPFAGAGRSGRSDISSTAEEILASEWARDRDR